MSQLSQSLVAAQRRAEAEALFSNPRSRAPANLTGRSAGRKPRAALSGGDSWAFPYDASSWYQAETENWFPVAYSPDHEINIYRDRMVARVRDVGRNDGWVSGAILNTVDQTIGGSYRLIALPNWRLMARRFGSKFDAKWAQEYRQAIEGDFTDWADDPCYFGDAERQLAISDQLHLAMRHQVVDGEALGAAEWHPERVGYGAARYATTLRLIDPDRLSNPYEMIDTRHRRGGVEIDDDGVPTGYHLRRAHQFDWYDAVDSMIWDFVPRETEWGRPVVLHYYDRDRVTQHRGLSALVPVLNDTKMINRFDSVTLQAAVIASALALAIESPYDPAGLKDLFESDEDGELSGYSALRAKYRGERPLRFENATVLPLFSGEQAKAISTNQPSPEYDPFVQAHLRRVAAALGTTVEEVTRDWSKSNYSSARAGFVSNWRTIMRRRARFDRGFARRIYVAWHEEAYEIAGLPLPSTAPDFPEARGALTRCKWIGAPRGWVDPVKEAQGAVLRMDAGVSTLQQEAAEQGHDWEELLDQRALERDRMRELGIPEPAWIAGIAAASGDNDRDDDAGGGGGAEPASKQSKKPSPT